MVICLLPGEEQMQSGGIVQPASDRRSVAQQQQQAVPDHGGRQDQGQRKQRLDQRLAAKPASLPKPPGRQKAERQHQRRREAGDLKRQPEWGEVSWSFWRHQRLPDIGGVKP